MVEHRLLAYHSDEEELLGITEFVRRGLRSGARVMCMTEPLTPVELRSYLRYAGVPWEQATERGQLVVRPVSRSYLQDGAFEPERALEALEVAWREARQQGWDGLWVAGNVSWAGWEVPGAERLLEYEEAVAPLFEQTGARALCLYDQRFLPGELVEASSRIHPEARVEGHGRRMASRVQVTPVAPPRLWRIDGEVDLSNAGCFARRLAGVASGARCLVLDVEGMSFVDLGAMRVLLGAAREVGELYLLRPSQGIRRMLREAGFEVILTEQPDAPDLLRVGLPSLPR